MNKKSKIYIPGHTGLVGSSLINLLKKLGYKNILMKTHKELDLENEVKVKNFFKKEKPEYVFICAGKVGGIKASIDYPADFIYKNLKINLNIIHYSYVFGVKKLIYIGCSCLYPKNSPQPMKEEYLFKGKFEPTNEFYSTAKMAALKLCQAYNKQYKTKFICCIAENLYGPNDNFSYYTSHVIPALIRRFHLAKIKNLRKVKVGGKGEAVRSFMFVGDLSRCLIILINKYRDYFSPINVGIGEEISIKELAYKIKKIVNFQGEVVFDKSFPEGEKRRILDVRKIKNLGWRPQVNIEEGLKITYEWFVRNFNENNNS